MEVREVMNPSIVAVDADARPSEAITAMAENEVPVLVVTKNGRVAGVVTRDDIASIALDNGHPGKGRVADVMTKEVAGCYDDVSIEEAIAFMTQRHMPCLPIFNRDQKLVGFLTPDSVA